MRHSAASSGPRRDRPDRDKENFTRVVTWDSPSHVCYPPPSMAVSYHGAWPADVRPSPDAAEWRDIWGVTWTLRDGEAFPTGPAVPSIHHLDELEAPDPRRPGRFEKCREAAGSMDRDRLFLLVCHPYFLYEKGFNILGPEEFLASLWALGFGQNLRRTARVVSAVLRSRNPAHLASLLDSAQIELNLASHFPL